MLVYVIVVWLCYAVLLYMMLCKLWELLAACLVKLLGVIIVFFKYRTCRKFEVVSLADLTVSESFSLFLLSPSCSDSLAILANYSILAFTAADFHYGRAEK